MTSGSTDLWWGSKYSAASLTGCQDVQKKDGNSFGVDVQTAGRNNKDF